MIKLKKLIQEVLQEAGEPSKYWWLGPDGKFQRVPPSGHAQFAWVYLSGIKNVEHKEKEDIYELMGQMGWIRIALIGYMGKKILEFSYSKKRSPSNLQHRAIKDLAKAEHADEIRDNTSGDWHTEIDESDEVPPEEKPGRPKKAFGQTMTYDDLLKATTPARKEKAQGHIRNRSIPVSVDDEGHEQWNFRYRSDRQTGDPGEPYQGRISFLKGEVAQGDDAMELQCEVDCECKDYMYRFAYNNASHGAGQVGNDTLSGVINRKPKPAYDYGVGLCKHLASLRRYLETKIKATGKSNLFEAVSDVARQGPFTITYQD